MIPTPFNYFFSGAAPRRSRGAAPEKKFGGGEAASEPPLCESILTDLVLYALPIGAHWLNAHNHAGRVRAARHPVGGALCADVALGHTQA